MISEKGEMALLLSKDAGCQADVVECATYCQLRLIDSD